MRVALFITCLNDTFFPATGRATVEVLERVGCTVSFPREQTCCGQMHLNTGYPAEAARLARRQLRALAGAEAIVTPSASCAATMREHYPELVGEAPPVHDLCSFLVSELGVEDVGARFPHSVAYHPTCHSLRSLQLGDAPSRLLGKVREIDLLELEEADSCCGFGGTFAVKNADVSTAMLTDKIGHLLNSGAEVCTAVDNSCLMHIGGGLRRLRAGVRTVHLAEILAAQG
ncbi:MAG: (Fe-S)-binding protein [Actinobacteria bacterium]|nr:(Fe-S)-binding protein [Actinomycetota bacterium]